MRGNNLLYYFRYACNLYKYMFLYMVIGDKYMI